MAQRDEYWDVVKGLGTILVFVGHTGAWLTPYVYMYNLVIFFFVAGYFYKERYTPDPFGYMGSRLQRLWWPCVQYALFFVVIHNVMLRAGLYTLLPGIPMATPQVWYDAAGFVAAAANALMLQPLEDNAGTLWFFNMMMLDLCLLVSLRHVAVWCRQRWQQELVMLAGTLALYAAGCLLIRRGIVVAHFIPVGLVLFLLVYLGWVYQPLNARLQQLRWLWPVTLLLGALVVYGVRVHTGASVELSAGRIIGPKWFALVSVSGIILHLSLCRATMLLPWLRRAISCVGRHSLHIIALNFLSFKVVNALYIAVHGLSWDLMASSPVVDYPQATGMWWVLYVICGTLLPLVQLWGWKRLRDRLLSRVPEPF